MTTLTDDELAVLTMAELQDLLKRTTARIDKKAEDDKAEAIRQIEELAAEAGLIVKLTTRKYAKAGTATKAKGGYKQRPKYRNPEPPHQTWGGGGSMPQWYKAARDRGMSPDELRVTE